MEATPKSAEKGKQYGGGAFMTRSPDLIHIGGKAAGAPGVEHRPACNWSNRFSLGIISLCTSHIRDLPDTPPVSSSLSLGHPPWQVDLNSHSLHSLGTFGLVKS